MFEAQQLVNSGVTELNLIAEDTNQWGMDFKQEDPRRLADLLYKLADIEKVSQSITRSVGCSLGEKFMD